MDIIKEFYPLDTSDSAEKWIQEDILDNYGDDFRVHIVRVSPKTLRMIHNACIRKRVMFRNHTSTDRLSEEDIKEFFKDPLTKHVVIGVKGFFRRANLIPNQWKLRIGATHELYTKKVDNNVQIQGLCGRMTGYWRDLIENGHKTGPHRTSIVAIEEYEKVYMDPFGINSYQSSGFKKSSGKVSAESTMLSAKHIKNLEAIELPEIDIHDKYDITELYNTKKNILDYLIDKFKFGKITCYQHTETSIQYRGKTIFILPYENKVQFKKLDIYGGINQDIVCRVMPVIYNHSIKYIGIYLKSALK
jgi:hypothetical protein